MMANKQNVLLLCPGYPDSTLAMLDRHFQVCNLWEQQAPNEFLQAQGECFRAAAGNASVEANVELFELLPNLELLASFGVGLDKIDLVSAKQRNIKVTYTPDVLTADVADLAMTMMSAFARGIIAGDRHVRRGDWLSGPMPLGSRLSGKQLGVLGLGRIGQEIAKRAQLNEMLVCYAGPREKPDQPYRYYDALIPMAQECDYLVISCMPTPENRHIISEDVLTALGPSGVLVNIARGSVVDESALVRILLAKKLGGALLDVYEQEPEVPAELFELDNVILTPHIGSATHQTRAAMGQLVVDNLVAHFSGESLVTPVED